MTGSTVPGKASRQRAALHTSTSELHARPRAEGISTIWTVTAQIASKNWEEHLVTPEKAGGMYMCHMYSVRGGQEKDIDSLDLKSQMVMSHYVGAEDGTCVL